MGQFLANFVFVPNWYEGLEIVFILQGAGYLGEGDVTYVFLYRFLRMFGIGFR
jgi:hypothetical protein